MHEIKRWPEYLFKYSFSFLNNCQVALIKESTWKFEWGTSCFKWRWRKGKWTNLNVPLLLTDELFKKGIDSYKFPDLFCLSDRMCAKKMFYVPQKRHHWKKLHLHFYVLASISVLLLTINSATRNWQFTAGSQEHTDQFPLLRQSSA